MGCERSRRTLQIEHCLKQGHTISAIAREFGVARRWVQQVRARLTTDFTPVTSHMREVSTSHTPASVIPSHSPMKQITITMTNAVHDALVEMCALTNRQSPEDPITIAEYTEELIINKAVEMGLLRKRGR